MQRIITAITKGRNIGFALSVMVVFIATYLLILPAMTLEKDAAERQGGIDVVTEQAVTEQAVTEQEDPSAPAAGSLSCEGEGYSVSAEYGAKAGLPLGAELTAEEITEEDAGYLAFRDEALKALQEEQGGGQVADLEFAKFYDITLAADGDEIEPEAPVDVTISYDRGPKVSEAEHVRVVHFGTDQKGRPRVEVLKAGETDAQVDKKGRMTETSFKAEGFSVYAVVYTVDFHYEVDGETFEYSLPGGGFISFTDLVEALGISEDSTDFVADVKGLEFSNPKLVDVSKVDEETTVGKIKEERGLKCEYSADLTEAQIEEINAQTVQAGDWALISLQPFDTEESLTVTMKTGEVFTIRVTDALHVNPDELVGKEVVIFDKTENRALTSDWEQNQYRTQFGSIEYGGEGTTTPDSAHWTVEKYNGNYYLKSHDGKYLKIDNTNVSLENNWYQGTALTIQMGGNPDYRIYSSGDDSKILTYSENNNYDGFFAAPGGTGGTGNTRVWLGIDYAVNTPDPVGDWMLYFDDDFDEITIHVGETVSLRPYKKWEWKEGNTDVQTAHWNIGGKDNNFWNQIDSGDNNGAHETEWDDGGSGTNTAAFHWSAYVKKDTELVTHYWAVQGRATKTGVYYLTNTKTGKTIKVNVVDGDPVNKPKIITDTVDIKVNLFDYDRNYLLDPTNNTNLANNNNNKNDSTNAMNGGSHFYFMSSGAGNNGNPYSWNNYTQGAANTGIVRSSLGTDDYPALAGGQSLKYLFDTSKTSWNGGNNNDGMIAYPNVNGMFQRDSDGYYYFNSNTNYFYYNNGSSYLYEHTYTQTSSKDKGSLENDKPIGFFPFHDYDATRDLYVNQNHNLNHHLGMSMEIPFKMNSSKTDENGQPIKFEFTGDDDLWVFAEWEDAQGNKHSKLVLDVGGIHQPVYGYIDFTNDKSSSLGSMGLQPGVDYKLKVYYLERGGCDSNLAIRFNIPLTNIGDVPFTKRDAQTNDPLPGAVFGLYTEESCSDASRVRQAASDESGHVLFSDVSIGTYYMKEITPPEGYIPSTAIYRVDVKAKNNAEITLIDSGQAPSDYSYNINNEKNSTSITFAKDWKDASGKDDTQVTYTLFQIAEPTAGGDSLYDNVYVGKCKIGEETKTGTASAPITFTVTKNSPVTVSDLPKAGVIGTTPVTYKYYALESEIEGFTPDNPAAVVSGTFTITNTPIPPSATFEDV